MLFTQIIHPIKRIVRSLHHYNLVNEAISRKVIDLINPTNSAIIVPYSDYPGIFTTTLLGADYERLVICDTNELSRSKLKKYVGINHPDRKVDIHEHDILGRSFKIDCDDSQDAIRTVLPAGCYNKDWKILTPNKLIVPLLKSKAEASFFTSLYYQLAFRNGLYMNGRMEFYMFVSGRQYIYLTAQPSINLNFYRSSTVLYNTVFDVELLHSINLNEGFNIKLRKIQATRTTAARSKLVLYNEIHLVRIRPKSDLFEIFTPNTLLEYRFLVNQCMQARSASVIPVMERWFPNCGADLHRMGFGAPKRFGDMTRKDLFRLYTYVSSRPDYYMSTLQAAAAVVDSSIGKLDEAQRMGC